MTLAIFNLVGTMPFMNNVEDVRVLNFTDQLYLAISLTMLAFMLSISVHFFICSSDNEVELSE